MTSEENPINARLKNAKHIILVLSGKGGVGKSSVSAQLALSLHATGARVGILDIDLTGPSIPRMLGLDGHGVHQSTQGWVPVYSDGQERRLACMSVGFLLRNKSDSVVWRGPKKNAMIRQFLSDVRWGELDYLVVDTPPGTSDEHLSLLEHLSGLSSRLTAVIVTTPQAVALADALKCLSFTRVVNLPVLGLIENMSGFVCPCCGEISNVFSTGGGEDMARRENLTFLGALPVDTELVKLLDHAPVEEAAMSDDTPAPTVAIEQTVAPVNNTVRTTTNATQGADGPTAAFPLSDRYQKTPTYALFKVMAAKIVEALKTRDEAIAADAL